MIFWWVKPTLQVAESSPSLAAEGEFTMGQEFEDSDIERPISNGE